MGGYPYRNIGVGKGRPPLPLTDWALAEYQSGREIPDIAAELGITAGALYQRLWRHQRRARDEEEKLRPDPAAVIRQRSRAEWESYRGLRPPA